MFALVVKKIHFKAYCVENHYKEEFIIYDRGVVGSEEKLPLGKSHFWQ